MLRTVRKMLDGSTQANSCGRDEILSFIQLAVVRNCRSDEFLQGLYYFREIRFNSETVFERTSLEAVIRLARCMSAFLLAAKADEKRVSDAVYVHT